MVMLGHRIFYVGRTRKENPEKDTDYNWVKVIAHEKFAAICRVTETMEDTFGVKFEVREEKPDSINVFSWC